MCVSFNSSQLNGGIVYSNFPKERNHTPSSTSCHCTRVIASLSNPLCNSHTPLAPRTLTSRTANFNSARGDKCSINPLRTLFLQPTRQ